MDPKYAQLGQLCGAEDPYLDLVASAAALPKPEGSRNGRALLVSIP